MKVAGLFAGIGGLELGLSAAGHETVMLAESWGPAQAVLQARFPDVALLPRPNDDSLGLGDVRHLRSLPEDVELLTAGFPCQDLSQAGRTAGIEGAKSGLVASIFRLLDDRRVPWVLLENVPFMLQLDQGNAMALLTSEIEQRGYLWAYRVVNSLAFGLPQRRERVLFLAAHRTTGADPADMLLVDTAEPQVQPTAIGERAHGFYWTEGTRGLGWAVDAVPTLKNGSTVGIPSPPAILMPDGRIIRPHIEDAERLQGFPAGWTEPAARGHRPSLRWSLVGNAVSVPLSEWIGQRLERPGGFDRDRQCRLSNTGKWPRAARFDGNRRTGVQISAFPRWVPRPPLHEFLRHTGDAQLLSARGTAGFLSRLEKSTLRADGAREALLAALRHQRAQLT